MVLKDVSEISRQFSSEKLDKKPLLEKGKTGFDTAQDHSR